MCIWRTSATCNVDYDRVKPQIKLDYILTEGDGYVSYELDTAYNFEFTVTTQTGEDKILVVSERSDVNENAPPGLAERGFLCVKCLPLWGRWPRPHPRSDEGKVRAISHIRAVTGTQLHQSPAATASPMGSLCCRFRPQPHFLSGKSTVVVGKANSQPSSCIKSKICRFSVFLSA